VAGHPLPPKRHESNNFTSNRVARSSHRYDHMRELSDIFKAVENAGYSKDDIIGKDRKHPLAIVRQIAMWLAREGRTYEELGDIFKRNHAACVASVKRIDGMLSYKDSELMEVMEKMEVAQ